MSALTAGRYLDSRFRLIRPLGEGEPADIWLADDVDLGERVAVAMVPPDTAAERIATLRSASTTPPFDFYRCSGLAFIAVPYSDDRDAGAKVAAILERLRGRRRDAADEGASSAAGEAPEISRRPARLTPPPRVQPIRPITPRLARRPEERPAAAGIRPRTVLVIVAVVALIVAASVFLLSREILQRAAGDPSAAPPPAAAPLARDGGDDSHGGTAATPAEAPQPAGTAALGDLRRRAYLKDEAEEAARRANDLGESLRNRGVTLWGDERFATALQRMADGDARLAEGEFEAAEDLYLEAVDILQAVDSGSLDLLQELLAEGRSALAAEDATAAAAAFSLAARIDPSSRTAATGVRRAEVLDDLNALLDEGRRQERDGDIAAAQRTYRRAAELDPLSPAAREALARVKQHIGDDVFAAEISAGLAALDRDDFEAAREAFRRAGALRPDSRQVADGLVQAEEGEKLAAITAHRDRALEMEKAERWRAAEKEYDAILRLDPAIRVAGEGAERARVRADLSEALAYHLDHPDRLAADEVFDEASRLRDRAAAIAPSGPRLRAQVEALDALLVRMREAVRVVLESDERTEVTIYRVGRLGTFSRHVVELRPGTYTVVGTRRGYRDVRHQLVITPGQEPDILVVRCEEKI